MKITRRQPHTGVLEDWPKGQNLGSGNLNRMGNGGLQLHLTPASKTHYHGSGESAIPFGNRLIHIEARGIGGKPYADFQLACIVTALEEALGEPVELVLG